MLKHNNNTLLGNFSSFQSFSFPLWQQTLKIAFKSIAPFNYSLENRGGNYGIKVQSRIINSSYSISHRRWPGGWRQKCLSLPRCFRPLDWKKNRNKRKSIKGSDRRFVIETQVEAGFSVVDETWFLPESEMLFCTCSRCSFFELYHRYSLERLTLPYQLKESHCELHMWGDTCVNSSSYISWSACGRICRRERRVCETFAFEDEQKKSYDGYLSQNESSFWPLKRMF